MSLAKSIAEKLGASKPNGLGYFCNCPCCHKPVLHVQDDQESADGISILCGLSCHFSKIKNQLRTLELINATEDWENGIAESLEAYTQSYPDSTSLNYIPQEQVSKQYVRVPMSDMLSKEPFPQNPLLTGIFDVRDKVVIIGQSKTRKSFFAEQLAFCLGTARSFLGFQALEAKRVLLIQSEIHANNYHRRSYRMAERLGITASDASSIAVINARGCADPIALIEAEVHAYKPDIVIIDPFYKLISGDESKSEDIKPILQFFDSLSEKTGVTVIYIHHDKKGASGDQQLTDRGSGSGVLARDFDSAIFLTPHKDDKESVVVEFVTRNYAPQDPITITWFEYAFNVSELPPIKKTSKTANKQSMVTDQYVGMVKKWLLVEYIQGKRSIAMGTFNSKLEDFGINARRFPGIKDQLIAENIIEIITQKAEKGGSCKRIKLLEPPENPQETMF